MKTVQTRHGLTQIKVVQVAIPSPLHRLFDYLPPTGEAKVQLRSGQRVLVPFGRQKKIGVIAGISEEASHFDGALKSIIRVLDPAPLFSDFDQELLRWVARYYHHPLGMVWATALPGLLRRGEPAQITRPERWQVTELGRNEAPKTIRANAHRQNAIWQRLAEHPDGGGPDLFQDLDWNWRPPLRSLIERGWVQICETDARVLPKTHPPEFTPNTDQQAAIDAIRQNPDQFAPTLLDGVTGSGKTEVYLQLIEHCLQQGRQVLVLLPEISLTPQLASRFEDRIALPMAVYHSGLTDHQRAQAWLQAQAGESRLLLGTRSAVFTPMPDLGLIILDEEHDLSFKQQEGLRYSARDVAIMRAKQRNIPVVLGSATPALESLLNARHGRYQHLQLPKRAGYAKPPTLQRIDCRQQTLHHGLSTPLIEAVQHTLDQSEQVLLFLNQRGFAPTLMCHACGWVAQCQRCDARLVIHQLQNRLKCHHCGVEQPIPERCEACQRNELFALGQGTQRIESGLTELFPNRPVTRIDRDSTRRKGALEASLQAILEGEPRILVGTQMLAKGHHFPKVTLVGILDVDAGLFSCDFRASERMAQLILQVAGRAGRAEQPGRVLLQTHHPDHPLLETLITQGYAPFATAALQEREQAELPPYGFQALYRAEATQESMVTGFLQTLRQRLHAACPETVDILGPVPAPMLKRAGRFRHQLLLQSTDRKSLHQLLNQTQTMIDEISDSKRVRWSLDIDPLDLF